MPRVDRAEAGYSLPEASGLVFTDYKAYAGWMTDMRTRAEAITMSGPTGPDTPIGHIGLQMAIGRSQNADFARLYDEEQRAAREHPEAPFVGLM